MYIIKSTEQMKDLAEKVEKDPKISAAIKEAAKKINEIATQARPYALDSDRWIYRGVIVALGVSLVGSMAGICILVVWDKTVHEGLVALGSASVGAMAGLLAPSPFKGGQG